MNNDVKRDLMPRLAKFGQQHLLAFWDEIDEAGRRRLAEQIDAIDFAELSVLVGGEDERPDWGMLAARAESPPAFRLHGERPSVTREAARQAGEEALRAGRVGMILTAGGQGTRLGYDHPKSLYPIGPVSGHSLLQILVERLRGVSRRYGVEMPMYLMTSPATHDETTAFLDKHDRFGMSADDLQVFCQGSMPAVDDRSGRVLLAAKDSLALAPNGHGGMVAALQRHDCLADARRRGIETLFYGQVDNPLLQICDPVLVGYHLLAGSEMTTQVVEKRYPLEKVGNVVQIDGNVQIIEYSDLPESAATVRDPDGRLRLWAGNLAVHVFQRSFLDRVVCEPGALPFHRAHKKTPYVSEEGAIVEPGQPNSIKFERFIFDLLPSAQRAIVVESDPAESFAPVKNANGAAVDSPEIAQRMMSDLYRSWLRDAGAEVADDAIVEISPLWALDADDCRARGAAGMRVAGRTYLGE